jgi:hypothetical protein
VTATVPSDAAPGTGKVVSVTPLGGRAVTSTIEIVETSITGVNPEPVPWRPGAPVTITGTGFGADPGAVHRAVMLRDVRLDVRQWRETAIVAAMPGALPRAEPPAESPTLVVRRDNQDIALRITAVAETPTAITAVDPQTITLVRALRSRSRALASVLGAPGPP